MDDMHPKYGWLVTGPSNSPENSFYTGHPEDESALSMGPTMDQVLSGICWHSA